MDNICSELKHYDMDHRIMAAEDLRNRLSECEIGIGSDKSFSGIRDAVVRAITQDHSSEVRRAAAQAMSELIINSAYANSKERISECISLIDDWLWDGNRTDENARSPPGYSKTKRTEMNDCAAYIMSCLLFQLDSERNRNIPQDLLAPMLIDKLLTSLEQNGASGGVCAESALSIITEVARRCTPVHTSGFQDLLDSSRLDSKSKIIEQSSAKPSSKAEDSLQAVHTLFRKITQQCHQAVNDSRWQLMRKEIRLLSELGRWVSWETIGLWLTTFTRALCKPISNDTRKGHLLLMEGVALLTAKYHKTLLDALNADAFEALQQGIHQICAMAVAELNSMDITLFETLMSSLSVSIPGCQGMDFGCACAAGLVEAIMGHLKQVTMDAQAAMAVQTSASEMVIEDEDDWDIELADEDGGLEASDEGGSDWRRTVAVISAIHPILSSLILYDARGDLLTEAVLVVLTELCSVTHERIITAGASKVLIDVLGTYMGSRDRMLPSILNRSTMLEVACDFIVPTKNEALLKVLIQLSGALGSHLESDSCSDAVAVQRACHKVETHLLDLFDTTTSTNKIRILDTLASLPNSKAMIPDLIYNLFESPTIKDASVLKDVWNRIATAYVRQCKSFDLLVKWDPNPSLQELEFRCAMATKGGEWLSGAAWGTRTWLRDLQPRRGYIDAMVAGLMCAFIVQLLQGPPESPWQDLVMPLLPSHSEIYPLTTSNFCWARAARLREILLEHPVAPRWEIGYILGIALAPELDLARLEEAIALVRNIEPEIVQAYEVLVRLLKVTEETTLYDMARQIQLRRHISLGASAILVAAQDYGPLMDSKYMGTGPDQMDRALYISIWLARLTDDKSGLESTIVPALGLLAGSFFQMLHQPQTKDLLAYMFTLPVIQELVSSGSGLYDFAALLPVDTPEEVLEAWRARCPNPPPWDYRESELEFRSQVLAVRRRIWGPRLRQLVLTRAEEALCELREMAWGLSPKTLEEFMNKWPLTLTCQADIPIINAISGFYLDLLQKKSKILAEQIMRKPNLIQQMLKLVESDEAYVFKVDFGGGRTRSHDAAIGLRRYGIQLLSALLQFASPNGIRDLLRQGEIGLAQRMLVHYHMIAEANLSGVITALAEDDDTLATLATATLTGIIETHPDLGDMIRCNAEKLKGTLQLCHQYFSALLAQTQIKDSTVERLRAIEGLTRLVETVSYAPTGWERHKQELI